MRVNKFLSIYILMIVAVMLLIPKYASANVLDFEDAIAVGEEINIMIRPTEDSVVVKTLDRAARIGIYCEETPGWYRMIYGNYRGYIKADNVFIPGENFVFGNALGDIDLKTSPSYGSVSVDTVKMGYGVKIVDMLGDWYKVETEPEGGSNSEGYVNKKIILQTDADDFEMLINKGMVGDAIVDIHQALFERGFYGYVNYYRDVNDIDNDGNVGEVVKLNNVFDNNTEQSIKCFQYRAGIKITGLADKETLDLLYSDKDIHSFAQDRGVNNSVLASRWWEAVAYEFPKGWTATVYDMKGRKTYKVQRYSGSNHADIEPLTSDDTAILRACYGGSWSWDRHPVWVTVDKSGATYAGSTNGMPHAAHEARISGNGFNGHICCHFKDSYGHGSNSEDSEHSRMVKSAYLSSINYYEMNKALSRQD